MPDFSYSDINEAKRRVQEMKSRAREQQMPERSSDLSALIVTQKSKKDKAFLLSLAYLMYEDCDERLINAIISILFN